MKRHWTLWTLAIVAALALPFMASACDLFDGCPDGGFVLECGCVLCQPGYAHTQTGDTSNSGYDCWTCSPTRFQAQTKPNKCSVRQQPANPTPAPVSTFSMLGFQDFTEMVPSP